MAIVYNVLERGCEPRHGKGDVAIDLRITQDITIWPQETVKVPTGVSFEISEGSEVQLSARSSTALKGIYCHVGTIDSTFNGREVCLILTNLGDTKVKFVQYERVAQATGRYHLEIQQSIAPIDSTGSKTGFGSTGRM